METREHGRRPDGGRVPFMYEMVTTARPAAVHRCRRPGQPGQGRIPEREPIVQGSGPVCGAARLPLKLLSSKAGVAEGSAPPCVLANANEGKGRAYVRARARKPGDWREVPAPATAVGVDRRRRQDGHERGRIDPSIEWANRRGRPRDRISATCVLSGRIWEAALPSPRRTARPARPAIGPGDL